MANLPGLIGTVVVQSSGTVVVVVVVQGRRDGTANGTIMVLSGIELQDGTGYGIVS